MDESSRARRGAALLSVGVNVFLVAMKGTVAVLTGSVALFATAADSLIDLVAAGLAYAGVRIGSRPPDVTHAYGHEKFESLSSLAQIAVLYVTVGIIATEAWHRLTGEPDVSMPLVGIVVILITIVLDVVVSRRLRRVSAETGGSQALEADALHLSADVWGNTAVIVGLLAVRLGFPLGDPIAAFVVAALIAVTSLTMLRSTTGVLTDRAPDQATIERLHGAIESVPDVVTHHTLRARAVGQQIFLDVCVELTPGLTFERAHDISHQLQDSLRVAEPRVIDAVIHVEPAGHPRHQDREHHAHGFDVLMEGRLGPKD